MTQLIRACRWFTRNWYAGAPCVLIVEDEPLIALDLQDAMLALGFYVCGEPIRKRELAR